MKTLLILVLLSQSVLSYWSEYQHDSLKNNPPVSIEMIIDSMANDSFYKYYKIKPYKIGSASIDSSKYGLIISNSSKEIKTDSIYNYVYRAINPQGFNEWKIRICVIPYENLSFDERMKRQKEYSEKHPWFSDKDKGVSEYFINSFNTDTIYMRELKYWKSR